jgi:hypothetical protein
LSLEERAPDVQRQLQLAAVACERTQESFHTGSQRLFVNGDLSKWELTLQLRAKRSAVPAKTDSTNSLRSRGNQQGTERARDDDVSDVHPAALGDERDEPAESLPHEFSRPFLLDEGGLSRRICRPDTYRMRASVDEILAVIDGQRVA